MKQVGLMNFKTNVKRPNVFLTIKTWIETRHISSQ